MRTESELSTEIATLTAQLMPLQQQINLLREDRKKAVLVRIEEIRAEIVKLADEAEALTREAGLTFYRESFLGGADGGGSYWGKEHYWQSSDISC